MAFCQSCATPIPDGATQCGSCLAPAAAVSYSAAPPAASGISVNAAAALTYLGGFITGIIFLLIEPYKADPFVRFHAFQSILFNVAWIGLWIVWAIVGIVLGAMTKGLFIFLQLPIDLLLMVGGFALWAWLMYSAYQGKTFKLPVIGALAAKQAGL
ncbi:MAG TPA: hypothetical protein VH088_12420 [Terriglobales bacterium]|jgi:uncharacterized membrane protein|nr:hypothetical protein [Terriglobales bacterium]